MTTSELSQLPEFAEPTREAWLRLVEKALKGADFEKRLVQRTADGIRVEPLYTASSRSAGPAISASASPWQMSQLCIEADPVAANAVLREEIAAGATGVSLRIAAPGQAGLPATAAALGKALEAVDLCRTTLAFQAGESARAIAAALDALWADSKTPAASRSAAFNADPIGDLARSGGLGEPLESAVSAAATLASEKRWRDGRITVLIADGRPYHEAGASEGQELACCLATLVCYLRACEASGLAPSDALARISLGLAADSDLFLSIAKLRAARRLVARVTESVGAAGVSPRLAVTTSERMMARRDPWVNLLRTCAAGMAAALAGADAITILPFTWAIGRPDAFARRIARNMHVVLREESGLARTADPAGGSWYIDTMTDELARKAWTEFQAIEGAGGIEAGLRSGFVRDRIGAVAVERAKAIATGRSALTGVSAFPKLGPDGVEVQPHDRPAAAVGKIDSAPQIAPIRLAEPFEALRDRADAAKAAGRAPRIFLASLGTTAEHSARTTWITNFLAAGGIEVVASEGLTASADVGRAFADSGAKTACICSSDQIYAELAEATAGVLKQAGASKVLLAGRPKNEAELKAAGVDSFLFSGQDAVATLTGLHRDLGI